MCLSEQARLRKAAGSGTASSVIKRHISDQTKNVEGERVVALVKLMFMRARDAQ